MEVTLIDSMGDDLRVVNAARVSFAKEHKEFENNDVGLINYLARHNHFTPFTHVQITLREKVPIFVARQRFKHMVGFTYNEVSRRYVDDAPEFFEPLVWRGRAENKKQGSSDEVVEFNHREFVVSKNFTTGIETEEYRNDLRAEFRSPTTFQDVEIDYRTLMGFCHLYYDWLLEQGVAPEQARMVLPQSMYTEYYVTGSLAAWARAYKLRIDPHAQKEIQDLAVMWDKTISAITRLEHSWKALTNEAI
jgi:thymidylate synthase (FAD)